MWFKKEDTVDSLVKDCNKLYSNFKDTHTLAHTRSYYQFKVIMDQNFQVLRELVTNSTTDESRLNLLKSFKEQLEFFNEYTFSAEPKALEDFADKFFPYKEKMMEVAQEQPQQTISAKRKI